MRVEDASFFDNTQPVELAQSAEHREPVIVLGYPVGGKAISLTSGVVSRIEYKK